MLKATSIVLALLLSQFASNVRAENWQDIFAAPDGSVKETIDADSIKPYQEFHEAWIMIDFAAVQTENNLQFRSIKMQQVFDCPGHRTAAPQHNVYAGAKGSGDIVYQHKPADNEPLDMQETTADTPNGAALIFVCHYLRDHATK